MHSIVDSERSVRVDSSCLTKKRLIFSQQCLIFKDLVRAGSERGERFVFIQFNDTVLKLGLQRA